MVKSYYQSPVSTLVQFGTQNACLVASANTEMVSISERYDTDDFDY